MFEKVKDFWKKHKYIVIGGGMVLAGAVALVIANSLRDKDSFEEEYDVIPEDSSLEPVQE